MQPRRPRRKCSPNGPATVWRRALPCFTGATKNLGDEGIRNEEPLGLNQLDQGRHGWDYAGLLCLKQDEERAMGLDAQAGGASSRGEIIQNGQGLSLGCCPGQHLALASSEIPAGHDGVDGRDDHGSVDR